MKQQTRLILMLCLWTLGISGLLFSAETSAFGASLVVPMEGEPFMGELAAIHADGRAVFRTESSPGDTESPDALETRMLPLNELVRWGSPALPQAQPWALLSDDSLLVAAPDWSEKAAVRTDGDNVAVMTDAFGEVALARVLVRGVIFDQRHHFKERQRLSELVRAADRQEDEVLLTNGDRLAGDVAELSKGSLTLMVDDVEAKLPISRVRAVAFDAVRASPIVARRFVVGFRDGSTLQAKQIQGDDNYLVITFADETKLEGATIEDVVFLQVLDSDKFAYLSDLEPVDYRHVPYLSIEWPWKVDQSATGEPLMANGGRYLKGIGMHSAARLTFRLDNKYQRFEAALAIDDSSERRGSVTFGVYLLRDSNWQGAFRSDTVRGGDEPLLISVDVRGARGMTLTVDYADRGDELDCANWLDARLIRK